MSSNALVSQGMTLGIGSGSPPSYNNIPEISNINGPGGQAAIIDVTDLNSSAVEKRAGLPDEGQISFEINYLPANTQHAALRTARANQTVTPFKLTFTDTGATEWTFNALVTGFTVANAVNGVTKATITLELTGAITETP